MVLNPSNINLLVSHCISTYYFSIIDIHVYVYSSLFLLLYLYFCDLLQETGERCSDIYLFVTSCFCIQYIMLVRAICVEWGIIINYYDSRLCIHFIIYFALNEWQVCNDTIHETKEKTEREEWRTHLPGKTVDVPNVWSTSSAGWSLDIIWQYFKKTYGT